MRAAPKGAAGVVLATWVGVPTISQLRSTANRKPPAHNHLLPIQPLRLCYMHAARRSRWGCRSQGAVGGAVVKEQLGGDYGRLVVTRRRDRDGRFPKADAVPYTSFFLRAGGPLCQHR